MENEETRVREQNSAFGEQARQETETVLRRAGGESLDDYLQNVNAYLHDLNRRLGVQPEAPAAEEPADGTAAPEDVYFAEPLPEEAPAPQEMPAPLDGTSPGESSAPTDENAPGEESGRPAGPGRSFYVDGLSPYDLPSDASSGYSDSPADWKAAVAHPELYPDLDDPQVTGRKIRRKDRRAEKRAAKQRAKQAKRERRRERKNAPSVAKGDVSRFSFVTTLLNLGLYGGWLIAYFISLAVRSMMFTSAQAEMAMQGVAAYSVTISSPVFTVLKLLIYAMPVVVLLWMRGVLSADKKGLEPPDKKWLIAAFAADLTVGFVVVSDVLAAKLVFGA